MNAKIACLLDDLRDLSTQDCAELTQIEANEVYIALQIAGISVDAAQIIKGNFDWKDERSRKLAGHSY